MSCISKVYPTSLSECPNYWQENLPPHPLSPISGYCDRKHIWLHGQKASHRRNHLYNSSVSAELTATLHFPTEPPKLLVFRTDVSNPRSQVGDTCSVRVGLLSIMATHNCVLSTICRNFCPCPRLTSKEAAQFSGRICWYSGETATWRESAHHEYDHKSELISRQVIIDLFRRSPFMLKMK